ncbi:MAG: response regulator transcription factor [Patescibacteria group bacterium]|nr:response regulator transcription factor [Patescibacteria group bacterium]
MKNKILIIEDNKDLQFSLKTFLLENNFLVEQAFGGATGLQKIENSLPDLVILDLGLPDIDGESVCLRLKKDYEDLPVIILTARNTPKDTVKGFNLGADDYIPKPFDLDELLSRIKARLKQTSSSKLVVADLTLNSKTFEVTRAGKIISLTPTEFRLLEYLLLNKGKVLSREVILNRVWSYEADVETRVVDVYIGYLRKKIDSPFKTKLISCIRGFGYTIK